MDGKQAELLIEPRFLGNWWNASGVISTGMGQRVGAASLRPHTSQIIEVKRDWYIEPPEQCHDGFTTGNILDSNAEALVNTVNCVGSWDGESRFSSKRSSRLTSKPMLSLQVARRCNRGDCLSTYRQDDRT